jgi:hypothetical protein
VAIDRGAKQCSGEIEGRQVPCTAFNSGKSHDGRAACAQYAPWGKAALNNAPRWAAAAADTRTHTTTRCVTRSSAAAACLSTADELTLAKHDTR